MPWWWSRRETGSPYAQVDLLYDECVRLSHERGCERAAARKALELAELLRPWLAKSGSVEVKRRLAKALWRHSTTLAVDAPADALPSGREGVALAREVLEATAPTHASFDAVLRELVIAMNDSAEAAAAARQLDEREALLLEAKTLAQRSQGLGGRQALGTTVHNLAHHTYQRLVQQSAEARRAGSASLIALAEWAVAIRERLCHEPRVEEYHRWELANSTGQLGRILFLLGDDAERERGLELLARAPEGLSSLRLASAKPLLAQLQLELEQYRKLAQEYADAQLRASLGSGRIASALPAESACLLKLVCLLEAEDRSHQLLRLWFPDQLRHASLPEAPQAYESALEQLVEIGLVREAACGGHVEVTSEVEARQREQIGPEERERFARTRAQLWLDRFRADRGQPGPQTVRAGIAAAVYAGRFQAHAMAFALLEREVLPVACRTGEATPVLHHLQRTAAESGDRSLLEQCDARARWLATAHCEEGHIGEALDAAERGIRFSTEHGLGPLSVATWHKDRLRLLWAAGRHEAALAVMDETLQRIQRADDIAARHALREDALHFAAGAAKALSQWRRALALNAERLASMQARGASTQELAAARASDSAALIELGDLNGAEELLRACQEELRDDPLSTAAVLGERAIIATRCGAYADARRLKRISLQTYYRHGAWQGTAYAHESFGNELARAQDDPHEAGAHWLAAALVYQLFGDQTACDRVVGRFGVTIQVAPPDTLEAVIALVERTPSVRLGTLLGQATKDIPSLFTAILGKLRAR